MDITTINHAMQLHANLLKTGPFHTQTPSLIKLLTFTALSHHGNIHYAHAILTSIPNSTSHLWNTIIRGYSISSEPKEALLLFCKMLNQGSPSPDNYTYPFLLKSCARLHAPEEGRQIHAVTFKTDLQSDPFVQNSLIYMYSNCKEPDASHKVFDKMDHRDVVSYTSMIAGYVDNRRSVKALDLYGKMEREGISPNEATLLALLGACASTGALSIGQKIHRIICRKNRGCEAKIFTALIDMYAKCGCIRCSKKLFNEMPRRDVFSWTAMIEGLASHGLCEEALLCFHSMKEEGSEPDQLTFTAILSACRNAGWVEQGRQIFESMLPEYGIKPEIQHYGCMVGLLARAGLLQEAEELIRNMPIKPDAILWRTLASACKTNGNISRAEFLIKQHLLEIEPKESGNYVLLSNIYASVGKWQEKAKVRKIMGNRGIGKPPGQSLIEVDGVIHEFVAGGSDHPEAQNIYRKLEEIGRKLRTEGYHPKVSEVLLDMDDEDKESALLHHSEKLAIAFGLISMRKGSEIRIVKNLRSCEDCHNAAKLISKIYQREIIMRDRVRFHHFKDGSCSCGDNW